jgi:hypothetical protein
MSWRGARLAGALRQGGREPLEVYPYATLRLLSLPTKGKRTRPGRRCIHDALQPLVPGLDPSRNDWRNASNNANRSSRERCGISATMS